MSFNESPVKTAPTVSKISRDKQTIQSIQTDRIIIIMIFKFVSLYNYVYKLNTL